MNKVLFIAYYYPPINSSGTFRSAKFAKYLPDFGWQPIVLTTDCKTSGLTYDASLLADIPPQAIVRSMPTPRFPPYLARGPLNYLVYPPIDEQLYWSLRLIPLGLRLIHEQGIKLIYTSSAPWSALGTGYILSRLAHIPWVADFRDPWTAATHMYAKGKVPWLDKWLEPKALAAADAVVTVNSEVAKGLQQLMPNGDKPIHVITNGYDEQDFDTPHATQQSRDHLIVHLGACNVERGEPLLDALERTAQSGRQVDFRVRFIGWQDPRLRDRIGKSAYLSKVVSLEPYVSHDAAVELMRTSPVLLLSLGKEGCWRWAHAGKTFEYLRSGTPILAIVPEGAAAELVCQTGTGCVVHPDDIEGISKVLIQINDDYDGFRAQYYQPQWPAIRRYERYGLTERLAHIFDEVVRQ